MHATVLWKVNLDFRWKTVKSAVHSISSLRVRNRSSQTTVDCCCWFTVKPKVVRGAERARVSALAARLPVSMLLQETRYIEAIERVADTPGIPALQLRGPEWLLTTVR